MKSKNLVLFSTLLSMSASRYSLGYEGPRPLKDVQVGITVSKESNGVLRYSYKISNPSSNDGQIRAVRISVDRDSEKEKALPSEGLPQCSRFSARISEEIVTRRSPVPVGSQAPQGWSCSYGELKDTSSVVFGWGSIDEPFRIKPGKSSSGFALVSYGPPGIREIVAQPAIDLDRLPSTYEGDAERMAALEKKVKWIGKTIGPRAPLKETDPVNFVRSMGILAEEARALGWIKNQGILKSLKVKLHQVEKKLGESDIKGAKNALQAFANEVSAQSGKTLSSEAAALLSLNADFLSEQLSR
jgi:hypothetical protein